MKKGRKCICTIGGVAALCTGASLAKDYHDMKRIEGSLGSPPLHKFREKLPDIQRDKEETVLTVPKDMPILEHLHVYRHVLHGNVGNRDTCK